MIDFVPETNFPDQRAVTFIHSTVGSAVLIPREDDLVRLYIQQDAKTSASFIDSQTGRVDMSRARPEMILEKAQAILRPWSIAAKDGKISWWTIYVGEPLPMRFLFRAEFSLQLDSG